MVVRYAFLYASSRRGMSCNCGTYARKCKFPVPQDNTYSLTHDCFDMLATSFLGGEKNLLWRSLRRLWRLRWIGWRRGSIRRHRALGFLCFRISRRCRHGSISRDCRRSSSHLTAHTMTNFYDKHVAVLPGLTLSDVHSTRDDMKHCRTVSNAYPKKSPTAKSTRGVKTKRATMEYLHHLPSGPDQVMNTKMKHTCAAFVVLSM